VWVRKWVDYSTKYGLGYSLSNGCTGVYFNDNTKVLRSSDGLHFEYMERKTAERIDIVTSHTLDEYPKEIHKKVLLLKHFHEYLEGKNDEELNGRQA